MAPVVNGLLRESAIGGRYRLFFFNRLRLDTFFYSRRMRLVSQIAFVHHYRQSDVIDVVTAQSLCRSNVASNRCGIVR